MSQLLNKCSLGHQHVSYCACFGCSFFSSPSFLPSSFLLALQSISVDPLVPFFLQNPWAFGVILFFDGLHRAIECSLESTSAVSHQLQAATPLAHPPPPLFLSLSLNLFVASTLLLSLSLFFSSLTLLSESSAASLCLSFFLSQKKYGSPLFAML